MKILDTYSRRITILFLIFMITGNLFGHVVELKNGDRISGRIWRVSAQTVMVRTPYATLILPWEMIQKLNFDGPEGLEGKLYPGSGEPIPGRFLRLNSDGVTIQKNDGDTVTFPWNNIETLVIHAEKDLK